MRPSGTAAETPYTRDTRPRIYVVGDSVAAGRADANEALSGWGQHLAAALGDGTEVVNDSRDSATAHWYFVQRLPLVLDQARAGDVFVLALGVCDQAIARPDLFATPAEYTGWLGLTVQLLAAQGMVPVLATQTARHLFDAAGQHTAPAGDYSPWVRGLAERTGTPLLDLQLRTAEVLTLCGPEAARGYFRWFDPGEHPQTPDGIVDTLHMNVHGARMVAHQVALGLQDLGLLPGPGPAHATPQPPRHRELSLARVALEWRTWALLPDGLTPPSPRVPATPVSPTARLRGTADGATALIAVLHEGSLIGYAFTGHDGDWSWRRETAWPTGTHTVHLVAVGEQRRSQETELTFTVNGPPPAPRVVRPAPRSHNGPRAVFHGRAPGCDTVTAVSAGRWLGQTAVAAGGTWRFQLPHPWRAGPHEIEFTAVRDGLPSAPHSFVFHVVTVPDDHWLFQDPVDWHHCSPGNPCPHIRRDKPAGARNSIE